MEFLFNADQYEPYQGGGTGKWPLDDYKMQITNQETKPVANNPDNGYLELTLTCMEGPKQGQEFKDRFNLRNSNPKTVEIAYKQLSAYCHAIGRLQIQRTEDLVGGYLIARIGPQEDNDKYSEVKYVMTPQGVRPGKANGAVVAPQQAPVAQYQPVTPQPVPVAQPVTAWPTAGAPAAQAQTTAFPPAGATPAAAGAPPWAAVPAQAAPAAAATVDPGWQQQPQAEVPAWGK